MKLEKDTNVNFKRWLIRFIILIGGLLGLAGLLVWVVDPYFHYHAPLKGLAYPITDERYQNDGILKHFDYDAIITGTSMCERFKTSELDEWMGTNSVKTCFYGAGYKEINSHLLTAFQHNKDIRVVVRGLDFNMVFYDKDYEAYDNLPTYLYDSNIFNDAEYLLGLEGILQSARVLFYTMTGGKTTSFDEYVPLDSGSMQTGNVVLDSYVRPEVSATRLTFSLEDRERTYHNFEQNVISIARDNPETQFYYFFTPYSILFFDSMKQAGDLERRFDAAKYASELMLEYSNIHVFSFFDEYELICDLNNYYDPGHYTAEINSRILQSISAGENEIKKEENETYWENVKAFYSDYEYESLFDM